MSSKTSVRIYEGFRYFNIVTPNDFFKNEYLIVDVFDGGIVFKVPTLDYRGKQMKTVKSKSGCRQLNIYSDLLVRGSYEPDEDSTEDELIIYFK